MEQVVPTSDEPALLDRLRFGEDKAFGELFELHAGAVRRLARGLASDNSEADDITAETFFRVLQALRRGNGPRDNVRAYLLTVARRVCWEWHGARRDVPVTDDELTTRAGTGGDSQASTAEASLITHAFSSLPERWRTVLWQTEVEGEQPAVVAPHFGLSANATAALARRARLGLRAAYLQAHLAVNRSSDGCRTAMEKLGGYTAGSVTGAEARKVESHLGLCGHCRATHDELRQVCSSLRANAEVVVLLVPAAGLALGATTGGAGAGAGAGLASTGGVSGLAASGGAGGVAIAVGTKVKVGVALASTAAVGAVGVSGPLLPGDTETIGLPSDDGVRLEIAEATPTTVRESLVDGTALPVEGGVPQDKAPASRRPGVVVVPEPANEYHVPRGPRPEPKAKPARGAATALPGVHKPPGKPDDGDRAEGSPRHDLPTETGVPLSSDPSSTPRRTTPGEPSGPPETGPSTGPEPTPDASGRSSSSAERRAGERSQPPVPEAPCRQWWPGAGGRTATCGE